MQEVPFRVQPDGNIDNGDQLCHLGRLVGTFIQGAWGAQPDLIDEQDSDEQGNRRQHGEDHHLAPVVIIEQRKSGGKQDAHTQPSHLAAEHIGRRAKFVEREIEGGGIQHDQTKHHQRHNRQDQ